MKLNVKVEGVDELRRNLEGLSREYPGLVARSLRKRAELIMTAAKKIAPVRDGHLKNSGHVVSLERPKIGVVLGFGGPAGIGTNKEAVGYAIVQHEHLEFKHSHGEAKYLEKPLNAAVPRLARDIAEDVNTDKLTRDPNTARYVKRR